MLEWCYRKWLRAHAEPEVTCPEAVVVQIVPLRMTDRATGSDVTIPDRSDVSHVSGSMFCACATGSRALSPYSISTVVPMRMTDRATGVDRRSSSLGCATGSRISPLESLFPVLFFNPTGNVISGEKTLVGRKPQLPVAHVRTRGNPVTLLTVALSVMHNDTFCTTTIVRKKRGNRLRMRTRSLPFTWLPIPVRAGEVTYGSFTTSLHHLKYGFVTTYILQFKCLEQLY